MSRRPWAGRAPSLQMERALPCLAYGPGAGHVQQCPITARPKALPSAHRWGQGGAFRCWQALCPCACSPLMSLCLLHPQFAYVGRFNIMEAMSDPAMMDAAMDPEVSSGGPGLAKVSCVRDDTLTQVWRGCGGRLEYMPGWAAIRGGQLCTRSTLPLPAGTPVRRS